jgi:hypothetical protein
VVVAHFAEDRDVRHVDEIVVDLDHVLEGRAGIGQRELQVLDCFIRLSTKFARRPHQCIFQVEPELAGDEYQPVWPGGLDDVAVARRLCERLRIGKANVGSHRKPPVV